MKSKEAKTIDLGELNSLSPRVIGKHYLYIFDPHLVSDLHEFSEIRLDGLKRFRFFTLQPDSKNNPILLSATLDLKNPTGNSTFEKIGNIESTSGHILFTSNPGIYHDGDFPSKNGSFLRDFWERTFSSDCPVIIDEDIKKSDPSHFILRCGWGPGNYPIISERDDNGEVCSIGIDFKNDLLP